MTRHLDTWLPLLLASAVQTIEMMLLAFVIGLAGGVALVAMRLSPIVWVARLASAYITAIRGTPALAQLFFIYFGLAELGLVMSSFQAAVIGLGANCAAYVAEIYRAGIESVPRGQIEAARSIGMRRAQVYRYVIVPQMVTVILPPLCNQGVVLLKETSVASLIAAPELMLRAKELAAEYYMPLELYLITGLIYFALAFPLGQLVRLLERRLAHPR
jgi:His/Glu/Gln/Arg/opine family amino acid ABC transporter permease subunit